MHALAEVQSAPATAGNDWIDAFMAYTEGQPTPPRFRRWAAISAVAAALERRVWTTTMAQPTYPNLYVLLVGPPASGKTVAIDIVYNFWRDLKALHLAPKSMTSAALVDALKEANRSQIIDGKLVEYHSLTIACPEYGTFISAHDLEMMANLNDLWDCPRTYGQKRRHVNGGKTLEILNSQINILGGAQPGFLASIMPEEAWSMGYNSRLMMIYGLAAPLVDPFSTTSMDQISRKEMTRQLTLLTKAHGQFLLEPRAVEELRRWYFAGMPPIPTHSRLQHYLARRFRTLTKLCMIAGAARSVPDELELVIRLPDVEKAKEWLLEAESHMPDIFREMLLKSDIEVIKELHFACFQQFSNTKQKPLHAEFIHAFLAPRAPVEKIGKIIETAVRSGFLEEFAPGLYKPRALTNFGPE